MAILVTGAAGFIGFHAARALLARGEQILGIDNLNDYYDPALKQARLDRLDRGVRQRFRFQRVDFADSDALGAALDGAEFDRIVHLGAQAGVRYSLENPHAYVQSNLVGHLNLLELARQRGSRAIWSTPRRRRSMAATPACRSGSRTEPTGRSRSMRATKRADELMSESYATSTGCR